MDFRRSQRRFVFNDMGSDKYRPVEIGAVNLWETVDDGDGVYGR